MNENFDKINESLDVDIEIEESAKEIVKTNKKYLDKIKDKEDSIVDYEYTRGNLYSLIEKGQEAINGILELAQEGQQPRSYEVVGQLIKSVGDVTDKLIDLQKKMKDLDKEEVSTPTTVNNALFVGSTAELQKLLKNGFDPNKSK
ncbi:MAG: terminase small subunit [Candidatus Fonsibacter ubiquis]